MLKHIFRCHSALLALIARRDFPRLVIGFQRSSSSGGLVLARLLRRRQGVLEFELSNFVVFGLVLGLELLDLHLVQLDLLLKGALLVLIGPLSSSQIIVESLALALKLSDLLIQSVFLLCRPSGSLARAWTSAFELCLQGLDRSL